MVTPRSQRLTISKLVPTSSANFAWDHPLRLRACLKRSFGTRSSTLMMEAPSSQSVPASLVSFPSQQVGPWNRCNSHEEPSNKSGYPARKRTTLSCFLHDDHIISQQRDK